jgi:hypothetical protein
MYSTDWVGLSTLYSFLDRLPRRLDLVDNTDTLGAQMLE